MHPPPPDSNATHRIPAPQLPAAAAGPVPVAHSRSVPNVDELHELRAFQTGSQAATKRGGNPPEIASLLTAATLEGGAVAVAGFTLHPPAFGALQVLDEISSPLLTGGKVKFSDIAAAVCVLEDAELCWSLLVAADDTGPFNRHVWQRTKAMDPQQVEAVGSATMRLIRVACGLPAEESDTASEDTGNPQQPAPQPPQAVIPPAPIAAGSPLPSNPSWPNTASHSTPPSGNSPPPPLASFYPPPTSGAVALPPAPAQPTGQAWLRPD